MEVRIKKLVPEADLPDYKTEYSAGADLHACCPDGPIRIAAGKIKLIPTGFAMEIPPGYEGQVRPRSGLAVKGISIPNAPGTIDADYRGEVKVILINLSGSEVTIEHHDRIAQLVIAPVTKAIFREAEELSDTVRGSGGFGSTGVKKENKD